MTPILLQIYSFSVILVHMAVPKQRTTKSRRDRRRQHIYLTATSLAVCSKCKKMKRPHTVCQHCGFYKGKEVINVMAKMEKKEKKIREKEMKETEQQAEKPMDLETLSKKKF